MARAPITILDGPMGTELGARGVPVPLPLWSAGAIESAPDVVTAIHRAYAAAGATVHTANTFRTKRRQLGARWEDLARQAVAIARASVPAGHRVAGSIAPLEDCYRPDLSPPRSVARAEHRELARALADAGVDILLCETFPHSGEALVALEEAVATGREAWLSLTAGPDGTLLSPDELGRTAATAIREGAAAVLVNCVDVGHIDPFVDALAGSAVGAPFGAYANTVGASVEPDEYAAAALRWVDGGATVLGSCCGTGPAHVAALARRFARREPD